MALVCNMAGGSCFGIFRRTIRNGSGAYDWMRAFAPVKIQDWWDCILPISLISMSGFLFVDWLVVYGCREGAEPDVQLDSRGCLPRLDSGLVVGVSSTTFMAPPVIPVIAGPSSYGWTIRLHSDRTFVVYGCIGWIDGCQRLVGFASVGDLYLLGGRSAFPIVGLVGMGGTEVLRHFRPSPSKTHQAQ